MPETNIEKLERERKEKELRQSQLQKQESQLFSYDSLSINNNLRKDVIVVLHKQIAKNTTMAEFAFFLEYCKAIGLNPVLKEVWCYKDNLDNLITFAGKDGFVKKAKEDPFYLGYSSAYVCENDHFFIDIPSGTVEHVFDNKDRGKLRGAWSRVKSKEKDQRDDSLIWVPFEDFNKGKSTWSSVPTEMIKKVADCHALKQFVGIPGLQNEYEFRVGKDDRVTHINEIPAEVKKELIQLEKEEKRLTQLIEEAPSLDALKKFMSNCQTPELVEVYNKKKDELNAQRTES